MVLRYENTPLYKFIGEKMREILSKIEIINILSNCIKNYNENLKNKKVMFIIENKYRTLKLEEVFFGKRNFYHLTGIIAFDRNGKKLSSNNFYDLLLNGRINDMNIRKTDKTTDLKIQVLPQLMRLDRIASMIGDYDNSRIFLQTEKVAGGTNSCMGFVRDSKLNIYVPNTALKIDIRDITNNRNKIVAILKKDIKDNLYKNITYLKQNYRINDILKGEELNGIIDIDNIYSADRDIDKKIYNFLH